MENLRFPERRDDADLGADRGPYIRDVTTGMLVLAISFIMLRILARTIRKQPVGLDDWLLMSGMAVLAATGGLNYAMISYGLGRQAAAVPMARQEVFLKLLVVSQIIFVSGIALVKISILALYLRIFKSKPFKIAVYSIMGVVGAWWAAITFLTIFQCKPIEMSYKPWLNGTCIDLNSAFYGSSIPSIITDGIILCLPIRQVLKLQTSIRNKLVILFFFASGTFATFASIKRFLVVFQVDHLNGTWTLIDPLAWAMIEQASAVVSACLPTLRPLILKIADLTGLKSNKPAGSSRPDRIGLVTIGGSGGSKPSKSSKSEQGFRRLQVEGEGEGEGFATYISKSSHENILAPEEEGSNDLRPPQPPDGIYVRVEHSAVSTPRNSTIAPRREVESQV